VLALVGVGGTALYLKTRPRGKDLRGSGTDVFEKVVRHPLTFGTGAGVANGLLATARGKPMSIAANLVTSAVIGISEGMLSEQRDGAIQLALLSALGASAGMALFTRWNPTKRALVESSAVPTPLPAGA
jgi:hypothetical protein